MSTEAGSKHLHTQSRRDSSASLDEVLERLDARSLDWAALAAKEKLALLYAVRDRADALAEEWVAVQARSRGWDTDGTAAPSSLVPGLWQIGPAMFGMCVNSLIGTFEHLARHDTPGPPPLEQRSTPTGQQVAVVFPASTREWAFAPGFRGEVWLAPGESDIRQRSPVEASPGVCAVLGPGNYDAPVDLFSKLFVDGQVVAYKSNPVNEANATFLEKLLAPLVEAGYVAFVGGGAEVAEQLVRHPAVDGVLLTGSLQTYRRVADLDDATGESRLGKPVEAELGGVSPVIVVPGQWSERDLDHHAGQIVAAKIANAGHTCASPQVIITDAAWPQREAFLARVRTHLARFAEVRHFYPGADERCGPFATLPDAEVLAPPPSGEVGCAPVWLPGARRDADSPLLRQEAFGLVLGEVALERGDRAAGVPGEFLRQAVSFCNEELFGTLAATILVDQPSTMSLGAQLDEALAALHYGCIGVNVWAAAVLFFAGLPWGGLPGHEPGDIQSGLGKINNTRGFVAPQKSVLRSPFRSLLHPQPPRTRDALLQPRLGRYTLRPTSWRFAKLASATVFGV